MTAALALFIAILGAMAGSFAGVVAERLNTGEPWARGRSRCNACGADVPLYALVPIVSWLLALGRCALCRARVSPRYVLIEAALAAAFVGAYALLGLSLSLAAFLGALVVLATLVLYDRMHAVIPWGLAALLAALSLGYAIASAPSAAELGLQFVVAGAMGAAFLLAHVLSRGRAMGLGDAPLVASLALLAGPYAPTGLMFSFWIGGAYGVALLVRDPRNRTMKREVPFAPILAAGFVGAFYLSFDLFSWLIVP